MRVLRLIILFICAAPLVLAFQNCSEPSNFSGSLPSDANNNDLGSPSDEPGSISDPGDTVAPVLPPIVIPPVVPGPGDDPTDPPPPSQGLVGKVFYLLNDSGRPEIPATMKDKNGLDIPFPTGVDSVQVMIDRGIELQENIRLSQVFLPTFEFSDGFQNANGVAVNDALGNRIVEAFAFELKGHLIMGQNMQAGLHELALLSDDGATLEADMDNNGTYETMLVDNDGLHATRLGCSALSIDFQTTTRLSVRLRFYQGPRAHIALSLLMRKLESGEVAGQDARCGFASPDEWFATQNNSPIDLVNSVYGEIVTRGWFAGETSMFTNTPQP